MISLGQKLDWVNSKLFTFLEDSALKSTISIEHCDLHTRKKGLSRPIITVHACLKLVSSNAPCKTSLVIQWVTKDNERPITTTLTYLKLVFSEKKGRDMTQSYDKSPYTNRNVKRAK